jgi:ubiquinol-cytochrome c reductase cytochrome b subunit
MPAYGNALTPAETTALVRFLETLHPYYQQPATDASRQVATAGSDAVHQIESNVTKAAH